MAACSLVDDKHCLLCVQELQHEASDARHHFETVSRLSQSILSLVSDSVTQQSVKQKLHDVDVALQHIDSELGWFVDDCLFHFESIPSCIVSLAASFSVLFLSPFGFTCSHILYVSVQVMF